MKNNPSFQLIQMRLGFANNSSSSHSLLVLPSSAQKLHIQEENKAKDYGWDFFTLSTQESKQDYLAHLLFNQIKSAVGDSAAIAYIEEMLNINISQSEKDIDHQSVFLLPVEKDGVTPHKKFIQDFSKWLAQENVVILGGNDNDSKSHKHESKGENFKLDYLPYDPGQGTHPLIAHYDEEYGFWTLFSRETGAKVRISFEAKTPLPEHVANLPSSKPSLVDVKITDKCPFGCTYCYQASLPTGRHASLGDISMLAMTLGKAGVMEAALGGGEPTLHPYFVEILKVFKSNHVTPNFTTRNLAWLKNTKKAQEIINLMGSFAVSVDSLAEAQKAWKAWSDFHEKNTPSGKTPDSSILRKMSFQVVVGAVPLDEIKKILEWSQNEELMWNEPPITLLGYKDVGFGEAWRQDKPQAVADQRDWVKMVQSISDDHFRYTKFRIDTALAESAQDILSKMDVSNRVFHTLEGSTSMYVDMVKKTMAPSSYAASHDFSPFDENWLATFKNYAMMKAPATIDKKMDEEKIPLNFKIKSM